MAFGQDTLIRTENGDFPIGELARIFSKCGKLPFVYSFDCHSGLISFRKIERVYSFHRRPVEPVKVVTRSGLDFYCTVDQRFHSTIGRDFDVLSCNGMRLRVIHQIEFYGNHSDLIVQAQHPESLDSELRFYGIEVERTKNFAITGPESDVSIIALNSAR